MSNAVFPVLPGLAWNVKKTPTWNTRVQRAVSGAETRVAYFPRPIWRWTLVYEFLRQDTVFAELQTLAGFFNARQGMFDSFLYADPSDSSATDQPFGTGDGTTTQFQLQRALGGAVEPVLDLHGAPTLKINGVVQVGGYSVSATGLVTFGAAPAAAAALTWTGLYYWRVRFDQDLAEFSNWWAGLWDLKTLVFVSVR